MSVSRILIVATTLVISGCASDGSLTPAGRGVVTALCLVDAIAQPVAVVVVGVEAPEIAPLLPADQIAHKGVQNACASVNGKPVGVSVSP